MFQVPQKLLRFKIFSLASCFQNKAMFNTKTQLLVLLKSQMEKASMDPRRTIRSIILDRLTFTLELASTEHECT